MLYFEFCRHGHTLGDHPSAMDVRLEWRKLRNTARRHRRRRCDGKMCQTPGNCYYRGQLKNSNVWLNTDKLPAGRLLYNTYAIMREWPISYNYSLRVGYSGYSALSTVDTNKLGLYAKCTQKLKQLRVDNCTYGTKTDKKPSCCRERVDRIALSGIGIACSMPTMAIPEVEILAVRSFTACF